MYKILQNIKNINTTISYNIIPHFHIYFTANRRLCKELLELWKVPGTTDLYFYFDCLYTVYLILYYYNDLAKTLTVNLP